MARDRYQQQVETYMNKMYDEGYFRDSYNASNLFWQLGLDYWVWFAGFVDKDGLLHAHDAAKILAEVQSRKHLLDEIKDKEDREYFHEKYDEFVRFLQTAIELDEPIVCSI